MNNKTIIDLPNGYTCFKKIDFRHNVKLSIFINLISIIIGVLLFFLMNHYILYRSFFDPSLGSQSILFRKVILIFSLLLYLILHEFTHGLVMKCIGAKKIHFGFTGLYAYTSCQNYIFKQYYYIVCLAPIVLWGIVFLIGCLVAKSIWLFLLFYWLQIINITGSIGDLYISLLLKRYPHDTLINDEGTIMCFYTKTENTKLEKDEVS